MKIREPWLKWKVQTKKNSSLYGFKPENLILSCSKTKILKPWNFSFFMIGNDFKGRVKKRRLKGTLLLPSAASWVGRAKMEKDCSQRCTEKGWDAAGTRHNTGHSCEISGTIFFPREEGPHYSEVSGTSQVLHSWSYLKHSWSWCGVIWYSWTSVEEGEEESASKGLSNLHYFMICDTGI